MVISFYGFFHFGRRLLHRTVGRSGRCGNHHGKEAHRNGYGSAHRLVSQFGGVEAPAFYASHSIFVKNDGSCALGDNGISGDPVFRDGHPDDCGGRMRKGFHGGMDGTALRKHGIAFQTWLCLHFFCERNAVLVKEISSLRNRCLGNAGRKKECCG